jgi:hypothetical protein
MVAGDRQPDGHQPAAQPGSGRAWPAGSPGGAGDPDGAAGKALGPSSSVSVDDPGSDDVVVDLGVYGCLFQVVHLILL